MSQRSLHYNSAGISEPALSTLQQCWNFEQCIVILHVIAEVCKDLNNLFTNYFYIIYLACLSEIYSFVYGVYENIEHYLLPSISRQIQYKLFILSQMKIWYF